MKTKKLTFAQIRRMFWNDHPQFKSEFRTRKTQNDYYTDIRVCFTDYIYMLYKNEIITEKQYNNITL